MKKKDLSNLKNEDLLEVYRVEAQVHGEATDRGDYKAANKAHDCLAAAYRVLRSRGDSAQSGILQFLESQNQHLRCWAAAHALEFCPAKGEPVLRKLANSEPGVVRLNAETVLSEWKEGNLRFP